jgi:hypothetical protein
MAVEQPDLPTELEEAADASVIDDELYSHKRRLQAIHDAHDRCINVRNAVEDGRITGAISQQQGWRYYRGAIESLLMEVLPALQSDFLSLDRDYVHGVHLGSVTIEPPQSLVAFARDNMERLPAGATVPQPLTHEVIGLRQIIDLPSPLGHEFSVPVYDSRDSIDVRREQVTTEIPRDVLDEALQQIAHALEKSDMGLNVGQGRPHNSLGDDDGAWPWERDEALPHQVRDAVTEGRVTRDQLVGDGGESDGD